MWRRRRVKMAERAKKKELKERERERREKKTSKTATRKNEQTQENIVKKLASLNLGDEQDDAQCPLCGLLYMNDKSGTPGYVVTNAMNGTVLNVQGLMM